MDKQDKRNLMTELYLIELLEKVQDELKHCRTFISSKERIHPIGLEIYDELCDEVDRSVQAYRDGKWVLHLTNDVI